MFCNKNLLKKVDRIQKRALRIIYNEDTLYLNEPVDLHKSTTILTERINSID